MQLCSSGGSPPTSASALSSLAFFSTLPFKNQNPPTPIRRQKRKSSTKHDIYRPELKTFNNPPPPHSCSQTHIWSSRVHANNILRIFSCAHVFLYSLANNLSFHSSHVKLLYHPPRWPPQNYVYMCLYSGKLTRLDHSIN